MEQVAACFPRALAEWFNMAWGVGIFLAARNG